LSSGQPYTFFVATISSSPSGSPCAACESCFFGEPNPMWLSTMTSVGRFFSSTAVRHARASIAVSFASATRVTFQPWPTKRVATSSLNARSVWPSIVIRLLS
jgi:hypothetical protein